MLTFVWDIDDVLNGLMHSWFTSVWLPAHHECKLTYFDLVENPPHRILGIPKKDYLSSLDVFRESAGARVMQPNPAILEWFRLHGARHRHMALTARPLANAPHAAEWLFRHFGNYVRSFAVVPTRLPNGVPRYDSAKSDFLEWFDKADCLIDDNAENIAAARRLGICGVLYPQPWNASPATAEETLSRVASLAEAA
jgi:hypothetical protein